MSRSPLTTRLISAVLGLAAGLALISLTSSPAGAASNGEWSVSPLSGETDNPGDLPRPFFDFQVRPGETITDTVEVVNFTDETLDLVLYPSDALSSPVTGDLVLELQSDPRDELGRWTALSTDRVVIPPAEDGVATKANVPFTITFPDDITPGDYAGGILALKEATEDDEFDEAGLRSQNAIGTRIYVRVDGPERPRLEITEIDVSINKPLIPGLTGEGSGTLSYTVTNEGNLRMAAEVDAKINRTFGSSVEFETAGIEELLPGFSVTITETWEGLPPIGLATAEITVTSSAYDFVLTRSSRAIVIPWLIVAIVIITGLGFILIRRRKGDDGAATSTGDDDSPTEPAETTVIAAGEQEESPLEV